MNLTNNTQIAAECCTLEGFVESKRAVLLVAKSTFRLGADGKPHLDATSPLAVLHADAETEHGILPADMRPKLDAGFEVMVLGRAHSPTGRPVTETTVRLTVGYVTRRLAVTGDRVWEGRGADAKIGAPRPFLEMPLDWSRAFGGTAEIAIDEGAAIDVSDPRNPKGRGFDHFAHALGLAGAFDCPEGYPIAPRTRRLPNLEDPRHRVTAWDDAPLPACWAPAPVPDGLFLERILRRHGEGAMTGEGREPLSEEELAESPAPYERAHPDWVIDTPGPRAYVRLEGMRPLGESFAFYLPRARVYAEIRVGDYATTVDLHPRALILLPEERRFCLVFRTAVPFTYRREETRVARIGVARGWVPVPEKATTQVPI